MRLPWSKETTTSTVRWSRDSNYIKDYELTPSRTQEELQQRSNSQDLQIQSLLRRLDETRTRCKLMHYLNEAEMEAASLGQNTYTAGSASSALVYNLLRSC